MIALYKCILKLSARTLAATQPDTAVAQHTQEGEEWQQQEQHTQVGEEWQQQERELREEGSEGDVATSYPAYTEVQIMRGGNTIEMDGNAAYQANIVVKENEAYTTSAN